MSKDFLYRFEITLENETQSPSEVQQTISVLITDEAMYYINTCFIIPVFSLFALFGLTNNVLNVIVFYSLGLKDSMSIGLFALSITDFLVCLLACIRKVLFPWEHFFRSPRAVDLLSVDYIIGWVRDISYLCSGWINTFLSVERCVCVTFPFHVKRIFTRNRSIVVILVIYAVHIAVLVPVLTNVWLVWLRTDVDANNSSMPEKRLTLMFSDNWPDVHTVLNVITGSVLPIPSQVLLLFNVAMMIHSLKKSSNVRTSAVSETKSTTDGEKQNKLLQKERRLVKVVLNLALILTVCNIPRFGAVFCQEIDPDVAYQMPQENVFHLLWNLAIGFGIVNASVNIFVYLTVNSNYRAKLKEIFTCKSNK